MAEKAYVVKEISKSEMLEVSWSAMASGDVGKGIKMAMFPDKTVQLISGTVGSATLGFDGSLDSSDGTDGTWDVLHDPQGNLIALETTNMEGVLENPKWIRPNVGGSGGSALKIALIGVAQMPKR